MKGLMKQKFVLKIFVTLMLTFGTEGIVNALIPETVALQTPRLESSHKDNTVA